MPHHFSVAMDQNLTTKGAPLEFIPIPHVGGGFSPNDPAVAARTSEQMVQLLKRY